jgi:SAM-dependent methyltransferase
MLLAGKAGWKPLGIELSEPAVKTAREFGLDVIAGTLHTSNLPDKSIDVVTLWEVIEHVRSPLDELRQIAQVLKPGGVLALSTPNAASLRARQEGPDWYGYHVSREHLLFFTPQTLTFALKSAGFRVSRIHTRKVDPSFRRIFSKSASVATAVSQSHPGISKPAPVLQSMPIQALIRLREIALKPLEMVGLGHTLEVYAVKVS